jgi:hypothetical protein
MQSKTQSNGSDATPSPSKTLVATMTPSASTFPSDLYHHRTFEDFGRRRLSSITKLKDMITSLADEEDKANTKRKAPYLISKQDVGFTTLATRTCTNLVSRVLAHTFEVSVSQSRSPPHNLLPRVPPW